MHRMNWDDLQYVLAVVEEGSLAAAARRLGVNHATVLRRVTAFEDRIGSAIFARTPQGYQIRPEKLGLIAAAREVGHAIATLERLSGGHEPQLVGAVRITTTDTVCLELMPDILMDLRRREQGLNLSLCASNMHVDLSRLEAEVTVRPAVALPDGLVGDVAGAMRFDVYCCAQCVATEDLSWIGATGALESSRPGKWLRAKCAEDGVSAHADSFLVMRELAANGAGRALLPSFIADGDPRLRKDEGGDAPDFTVPLWVACHEDMSTMPRLRTVRRNLVQALEARAHVLDPRLGDGNAAR